MRPGFCLLFYVFLILSCVDVISNVWPVNQFSVKNASAWCISNLKELTRSPWLCFHERCFPQNKKKKKKFFHGFGSNILCSFRCQVFWKMVRQNMQDEEGTSHSSCVHRWLDYLCSTTWNVQTCCLSHICLMWGLTYANYLQLTYIAKYRQSFVLIYFLHIYENDNDHIVQ